MFRILWKILFPAYAEPHPTVRYAFPLVLVTALFASLASVVSPNTSYITIETNAETVASGDQFTVDVHANAHVPINAVDLVISYPEDKVVIDSIDTGTSVITLWAEKPYAEDGNIYLRGGTFRKGFIGEHRIAIIKAHATEEGEARMVVEDSQFVAGDGKGTSVPADTTAGHIVKIQVTGDDGTITAKAKLTIITDTDGDGDVDVKDISTFMAAWFTGTSVFDFNGDGRMTFSDFSIILSDSFWK